MDALGYVDTVKFIRQFDRGSGNYTEERHEWQDKLTMDDIIADIQTYQKNEILD